MAPLAPKLLNRGLRLARGDRCYAHIPGGKRDLLGGFQRQKGFFIACLTRNSRVFSQFAVNKISVRRASPADRRSDVADQSRRGTPYGLGTLVAGVERCVPVGDHSGKKAYGAH